MGGGGIRGLLHSPGCRGRWSGGRRPAGRLDPPPRCRAHGCVHQWSQSVTPVQPARCAGDTSASNRPHGPQRTNDGVQERPCPRLVSLALRHRPKTCLSPNVDDEEQVNTPMPKKASGPKKARWTSAQKIEARKGPKKPHHRGQPDGPKSAPKRAARPTAEGGLRQAATSRAVPALGPRGPSRRGSGRSDRVTRDSRGSHVLTPAPPTGETTTNRDDSRGQRPKRWVSDSREERHVHRPHDERPRRERGEAPVRDRGPRVADPARRDRHEGRHADRGVARGGDREGYRGGRDARGDDRGRYRGGSDVRRDDRGGYRGASASPRDSRGGPRASVRADRPSDAERPLSFEEAEAQRAEADTWTAYSSTAGAAA